MSRTRDRVLLLASALALFGAAVGGALYLSRLPEWVRPLVEANPAYDDTRDTRIAAFYVEGKATVVVTFRNIPR